MEMGKEESDWTLPTLLSDSNSHSNSHSNAVSLDESCRDPLAMDILHAFPEQAENEAGVDHTTMRGWVEEDEKEEEEWLVELGYLLGQETSLNKPTSLSASCSCSGPSSLRSSLGDEWLFLNECGEMKERRDALTERA